MSTYMINFPVEVIKCLYLLLFLSDLLGTVLKLPGYLFIGVISNIQHYSVS